MSKKGFKEILSQRGYFTAAFTFLVVAGVCAGAASYNKISREQNQKAQQEMEQLKAESVLKEKNARPQTTVQLPKDDALAHDDSEVISSEPVLAKKEAQPIKEEPKETSSTKDEDDTDKLSLIWPIEGEVVMDYSADEAIYDVTLDQYRTNDSVCIGADLGDTVVAAGDGVIESIVFDESNGNTIVINHNNGWKTTYGQLTEDVSVKEGQNVVQGETIGYIDAPSLYEVGLGNHLKFSIAMDEVSVNPHMAVNK